MEFLRHRSGCFILIAVLLPFTAPAGSLSEGNPLPAFGQDTVLVWKIQNQEFSSDFVVRIAGFSPDRFLEWEDASAQGTIFMPSRDIEGAGGYTSAHLFSAGADTRSRNTTTLWLSRSIFRELKEKKRAKLAIDGVRGLMTFQGEDQLIVEVNRASLALPVIKVSDDRGAERWFLDQEENPLMLKHQLRQFSQTLISITTDRPNTLRWIKGKKLANPPR
jgi:PAS domain-containing protein